jgi:putative DNA methylase
MSNNKRSNQLIEVALPLDAIAKASLRGKTIYDGHPSVLGLWCPRRQLMVATAGDPP